ncbi:hypothetical protein H2203_008971 [Taxawa tesnikishii (nom. ined.)]|nr:hypothetical protein H2203_008971 [Dothideales sp. JES 119]
MAPVQPTIMDKLTVVPVLMKTRTSSPASSPLLQDSDSPYPSVLTALAQLLTTPIRTGTKPPSVFKDVFYAALRTQLGSLNLAQENIVLSDGCKAHWIGAKKKEKVLVYLHGGGYVLHANAGHCRWLFDLEKTLNERYSLSIVLLDYTTAPEGQYPRQLNQTVELVDYLLKGGRTPSDIILAGDSAGANLVLGLLSHLLHPHPDVSIRPVLTEPFRGAVLISPWVKFATDDPSWSRNYHTDFLPRSIASRWGGAFLGSAPLDNYNQPILADESWFHGSERVIREVLVWGGGGEVLIDSIEAFYEKFKNAHPNTQYVRTPGVCHEDFLIDAFLGYKEKGQGTKVIEEWISARL